MSSFVSFDIFHLPSSHSPVPPQHAASAAAPPEKAALHLSLLPHHLLHRPKGEVLEKTVLLLLLLELEVALVVELGWQLEERED